MFEMAVFDMAGTTVNENNIVYKTLQQSIASAGYAVDIETVLAEGAGKEKLQAVKDILALPAMAAPKAKEPEIIHQDFLHALSRAYHDLQVQPYEAVEAVFSLLKENGIKVVLNTGYDRATATLLINKLNWRVGHQIDLLVTADEVSQSRPAPDMILYAMDVLGVKDPQRVLKVGDSRVDIEEGKAAGCGLSVGITTGAQERSQLLLAHPDHVIDSMAELPSLMGVS